MELWVETGACGGTVEVCGEGGELVGNLSSGMYAVYQYAVMVFTLVKVWKIG